MYLYTDRHAGLRLQTEQLATSNLATATIDIILTEGRNFMRHDLQSAAAFWAPSPRQPMNSCRAVVCRLKA